MTQYLNIKKQHPVSAA